MMRSNLVFGDSIGIEEVVGKVDVADPSLFFGESLLGVPSIPLGFGLKAQAEGSGSINVDISSSSLLVESVELQLLLVLNLLDFRFSVGFFH
jgi:hypothetical protein